MKKIVVDSSIIAEHLTTTNAQSILRTLSKEYFCYTTVFNAIELFSVSKSLKETQAVDDAMSALKVLGVNSKSAKNIAAVVSSGKNEFSALIAGVCIESKLPIITLNSKRFLGISKLKVYSIKDIAKL
ncbi:MAG: type II toxin-antitoxin system VapC family toxin [Bacteroidota bacterium]|nr:type II toxin-antitoxin system VapC family toxin [Bacteroidota bacterium]